jgi:uncharacterized protein YndB with AHSA1/START domain
MAFYTGKSAGHPRRAPGLASMLMSLNSPCFIQIEGDSMKSILLKIALALVVIVVGLLIVVTVQPNSYRVERTTTMAAPPQAVFEQVNDFHNWQKWSPWANLDPHAEAIFEGPESGEGATFRWIGNEEVGEGSMTILESEPDKLVRIRLDFVKPFEDTSTTEFTLVPEGDQTRVTWSMYGENNFVGKAFCLLMDMDKMIGEKYEEGFVSLKKIVEDEAKPADSEPAAEPTAETTEANTPTDGAAN